MGKSKFIVFLGIFILIFLTSFILGIGWIGSPWSTARGGVEDLNPSIGLNLTAYADYVVEDLPLRFEFGSGTNISSSIYGEQSTSFFPWISLDSSTGVLSINSTLDNESGWYNISMDIYDKNDYSAGARTFVFEINATNDAPLFSNLENKSFNMSQEFEYIVNVTDEEENIIYSFNITYLSCDLAQWSTRGSNCTLFSPGDYVFNGTAGRVNISFNPLRNDVGSYIMNFTVTDLNNNVTPYNASTSQIVNFTVLNVNAAPSFTYVCNNERNATEDAAFFCQINATDPDEINNLTYSSNVSWFLNNFVSPHNLTTGYNSSANVSFTPTDLNVGNWSINITVNDTGSPLGQYSQVINFYVSNANDSVLLQSVSNLTAYQGNSYVIKLNSTDDDLLIPDDSVYSESLTYSIKNITGETISWISVGSGTTNGNSYVSSLNFDATAENVGFYELNLSVNDSNGYSSDSMIFSINITGNNIPLWNNLNSSFYLNESSNFYLNLSEYASDADSGDTLSFYSELVDPFNSFSVDASTGVINFTPSNLDVGFHQVYLNVSDGKTNNRTLVSFNVTNLNNAPHIETPLEVSNATKDANSNIVAYEDNFTTITLWVDDDDYKIPSLQKGYYNESILVNVTIEGINTTLFNFTQDDSFPSDTFPNKTKFDAVFTPSKLDVGSYNITINASDFSNSSDFITFNMTINSINHNPTLTNPENQSSATNRSFYYRFNATDIEDGTSTNDSNTNFTFSYSFISGSEIFNSTEFNSTNGVLNVTFNGSVGGKYHINITVNDSSGLENSKDFWMFVYDVPRVFSPSILEFFNLTENNMTNISFVANHSVGNNLTYLIYVDNIIYLNSTNFNYTSLILRENISYFNSSGEFNWSFTPNFTDESYGKYKNLTLIIYPSTEDINNSIELNKTINWKVNITHTNSPVLYTGTNIGKLQSVSGTPLTLDLSEYFSDADVDDLYYSQKLNLSVSSNSTPSLISSSLSGWDLTLSSSTVGSEFLTVNLSDLDVNNLTLTTNSTNPFEVEFTEPEVVTVTTSVSGGGGGGSGQKIVSMKIIVPNPVSAFQKDRIVLPIKIVNDGEVVLKGVNLSGLIAKNNTINNDINLSFDENFIKSLKVGEEVNVTLTADIDTQLTGLFELTLNANVSSPKYSDWSKIYLTIKETDSVIEKILFTEEFIAENPECIELTELVSELKKDYVDLPKEMVLQRAEGIIDSCKKSVSQQTHPLQKVTLEDKIYRYLTTFSLIAFFLGVFYYSYRRMKLRRSLKD